MQIAVPRTEEVQGKTVFVVEITDIGKCLVLPKLSSNHIRFAGQNKWALQKRYSEFYDFRSRILEDPVVEGLPFPEKQLWPDVEIRRLKLHEFLAGLLVISADLNNATQVRQRMYCPSPYALMQFVHLCRHTGRISWKSRSAAACPLRRTRAVSTRCGWSISTASTNLKSLRVQRECSKCTRLSLSTKATRRYCSSF